MVFNIKKGCEIFDKAYYENTMATYCHLFIDIHRYKFIKLSIIFLFPE